MRTKNISLTAVIAGTFALATFPHVAAADSITGQLSFSGTTTAFSNTNGTGSIVANFLNAHSLSFANTLVSSNGTGSFAGITANTPVTMFSPLQINPAELPSPATSALWNVDGFSFTLDTLTEPTDTPTFLVLDGTGTISDGDPADATPGNWTAAFTSSGMMFSFNSASTVPDSNSSVALFGLGLCGLGVFGWRQKLSALKAF